MDKFLAWTALDPQHPAARQIVVGIFLLAVVVARAALRRTRVGRRLDSTMSLIAIGLVFGELAALSPESGDLYQWLRGAFIAAVGIGVARTILVLFVDYHLQERRGAGVSAIVRDVGSVLVYFFIILVVLRFTLDINLASLVATSAVLTAIIGLALQDVLGSVISGLVLELEDPFGPNDWVKVGTFEGQVLETGWRTTKIRTRVNQVITMPNTFLAREPVVNYSRPDPRYGDTLHFQAAYEAPPYTVKRAVRAVFAADPAVLEPPEIEVRTTTFGESAIEYQVRYWIDDFKELERIRDRLMTNLWYGLRRAGIRIPFAARDVYVHTAPAEPAPSDEDAVRMLRQVPLLAPLEPEDLGRLAAAAPRLLFAKDEIIVHEGEPGSSFYVIERGAVRVLVGHAKQTGGREVARLSTRDFFGEMSLLAGDPRSATVVAEEDTVVLEVGHAAFQAVVAATPAVLEPISEIAARRLAQQQEVRRAGAPTSEQRPPSAQSLLRRITAFFAQ